MLNRTTSNKLTLLLGRNGAIQGDADTVIRAGLKAVGVHIPDNVNLLIRPESGWEDWEECDYVIVAEWEESH